MWTNLAVLLSLLTVVAMLLAFVFRVKAIWSPPAAVQLLGGAAKEINKRSAHLYKYSPHLDKAIYSLIGSEYSKLRVAGDFLLTWRLHLTQETMNAQRKDIAPPLFAAVSALRRGDISQLNAAFSRLPVEPRSQKITKSDWRPDLIANLRSISSYVLSGNRSAWGDAAADLESMVGSLPAELKPPMYLLKGYLERPIKYTEVCLSQSKLKEQGESLSMTVSALADELVKQSADPSRLWDILAAYGERYRYPGKLADS